jgi:hypothetical protein
VDDVLVSLKNLSNLGHSRLSLLSSHGEIACDNDPYYREDPGDDGGGHETLSNRMLANMMSVTANDVITAAKKIEC